MFVCPANVVTEVCCNMALAGLYAGSYDGGGAWEITVGDTGRVLDGATVDPTGNAHELVGTMDANGRVLLHGAVGSFDGQVRTDGSVWGIWTDQEWLRGFSGRRQQGSVQVEADCTPADASDGGSARPDETDEGRTDETPLLTACHFQCTHTPTQRGCVPSLDEMTCEDVAIRNCGGLELVLRRQLVAGCVCSDRDPDCGHPNWLEDGSGTTSLGPYCYLLCQSGVKACLNETDSSEACTISANDMCSSNASQVASYELMTDCACNDRSGCAPAWW